MAMGELIRAKGLAVAVARTLITNCPERAPKCPTGPGRAITGGATCASACVLVLAGGVERLVGPAALVGVHQITTMVKETEGVGASHVDPEDLRAGGRRRGGHGLSGRHGRRRSGDGADAQDAGRQHSLAEPRRSQGLAVSRPWRSTPPSRSLTSGANGLNAPGVRRRAADRRISRRRASPSRSADAAPTLDVAFRYRRGGGAVEAEATPRESGSRLAADPPALGWSLTLNGPGGEPLRLTTVSTAPAARHHSARTLLRARARRQPHRRARPRRLDGRGGGRTAGGGRGYRNGRGEGSDLGSLSLTSRRPGRPGRGRIPATKTKADATKSKPGATKSKSGATKSKSSATKPK